jgi:hypothetical protein
MFLKKLIFDFKYKRNLQYLADKFTRRNLVSPQKRKGLRYRVLLFSELLRRVSFLEETFPLHLERLRIPFRTPQPGQTNKSFTQANNPEDLNPQNQGCRNPTFHFTF